MEETEGKFAPLTEEFQILEKYEVTVEEAHLTNLNQLSDEWHVFQECLKDAEAMLKKHKVPLNRTKKFQTMPV